VNTGPEHHLYRSYFKHVIDSSKGHILLT